MHEWFSQIPNRKSIPSDIAATGIPSRIDLLDVIGTSLTRAGWQDILRALHPGARLRLLLLDPDGSAIKEGAASGSYWWNDAAKARLDVLATVATVASTARDRALALDVRYYDRLPVSRYVQADQQVYQAGYPLPDATTPLPVAVLRPDTVLGQRAEREFDVLWRTRSRLAIAIPAAGRTHSAMARWAGSESQRVVDSGKMPTDLGETPVTAAEPADSQSERVDLIGDRKAVPADALARLSSLRQVDVIDVAGAAQVGEAWQDLIRARGAAQVRMRVLLLDPGGRAASLRATESTRWRGDDASLRAKIRRNIDRIRKLPHHLDLDVAVRVYDDLPISRYVRLDDVTYQSVYPANESAKGKPLAVLPAESVLGQRAAREFEVMWTTMSRDYAGGPE